MAEKKVFLMERTSWVNSVKRVGRPKAKMNLSSKMANSARLLAIHTVLGMVITLLRLVEMLQLLKLRPSASMRERSSGAEKLKALCLMALLLGTDTANGTGSVKPLLNTGSEDS